GVFGFSGLAVLGVFGFSGGRFSVPWVYRSSVSRVAAFGAVVRAGRPRRRGARVRGPARRTGAAGRSRSRIRRRADAWWTRRGSRGRSGRWGGGRAARGT